MKKDTVNRWQYTCGYAYLSSDFGQQLAMKKFGLTVEQLEEKVGRYKKGKRKGMLKGKLMWLKITKGGWVKTGPYDWDAMQAQGFIAKPGVCFGFVIVNDWARPNEPYVLHESPETIMQGRDIHASESLARYFQIKSAARHQAEKTVGGA